jgi:hypothetical protein
MNINLKLTVEEVNYILNALATRPYVDVKDLIIKIQKLGAEEVTKMQTSEDTVSEENTTS